MNADNTYFKTEITNIPVLYLKEIIQEEIVKLLFDYGQRVVAAEPEFIYLVNEITSTLRGYYANWKLNYVDECFRRGKLDEYDRGQKITAKRVQFWLKSYNIALLDKLKNQFTDKVYTLEDNERFAANGRRFPNIIKFRQSHKPDYDGPEWDLKTIEKTPEYQAWLKRGGHHTQVEIKNLIFTKI